MLMSFVLLSNLLICCFHIMFLVTQMRLTFVYNKVYLVYLLTYLSVHDCWQRRSVQYCAFVTVSIIRCMLWLMSDYYVVTWRSQCRVDVAWYVVQAPAVSRATATVNQLMVTSSVCWSSLFERGFVTETVCYREVAVVDLDITVHVLALQCCRGSTDTVIAARLYVKTCSSVSRSGHWRAGRRA